MRIPLNKAYIAAGEEAAVVHALAASLGTGDGPNSERAAELLKEITGAKYVLPVTSCTHGLELMLACMDLETGDEVIVPSFTMASTANAVYLQGSRPVFADIEAVNYNIDPEDIERVITDKTKGIIIVHYAGMPCQMERILAVAEEHNLFVMSDAAHAIGARYRGKALGTLARCGAFSFHGTKNISCGEGGAVLTDDKALAEKMEIFRTHGTNRQAFLRGEVDKYTWVGPGSSYLLSDYLASILVEQLKKLDAITARRSAIAASYTAAFQGYEEVLQLPEVPKYTEPNWHIYALKFRGKELCEVFLEKIRAKGIAASRHYVPLHNSQMGKRVGGNKRKLPVTEEVAKTLVRLPIYPDLSQEELDYVTRNAKQILDSSA